MSTGHSPSEGCAGPSLSCEYFYYRLMAELSPVASWENPSILISRAVWRVPVVITELTVC